MERQAIAMPALQKITFGEMRGRKKEDQTAAWEMSDRRRRPSISPIDGR
jgi:hypothetical protein